MYKLSKECVCVLCKEEGCVYEPFKEEYVCVLYKEGGKLYRGFVYELYKEGWKFELYKGEIVEVIVGVENWKVFGVEKWLVWEVFKAILDSLETTSFYYIK